MGKNKGVLHELTRCAQLEAKPPPSAPEPPLHLGCISPSSRLYLGRCAQLEAKPPPSVPEAPLRAASPGRQRRGDSPGRPRPSTADT